MVHLIGKTGQLANQLFRLAHHLANAKEYNYLISHYGFDYETYFPNLKESSEIVLNSWPKTPNQILKRVFIKGEQFSAFNQALRKFGVSLLNAPFDFNPDDSGFIQRASKKHIISTNWLFRDFNNISKHADYIRHLFSPTFATQAKCEEYINSLRSKHERIIGVHIRRGDYQSWEGGKYYYSDSVYQKIMAAIATYSGNKRIAFVLCSNETIDVGNFPRLTVFTPKGSFMEDLTMLSLCDQIIGPPSSFSGWASFSGNTPLYYIREPDAIPEMEDFEILLG